MLHHDISIRIPRQYTPCGVPRLTGRRQTQAEEIPGLPQLPSRRVEGWRRLRPQEVDELCAEWEPEALGAPLPEQRRGLQAPLVDGDVGPRIQADGRTLLNLASSNFLGLAGDESIRVPHRQCPQTSARTKPSLTTIWSHRCEHPWCEFMHRP